MQRSEGEYQKSYGSVGRDSRGIAGSARLLRTRIHTTTAAGRRRRQRTLPLAARGRDQTTGGQRGGTPSTS
jgi:hypothetical protein